MAIFVFFLIITVIFIFSSKKLSPIPYFPSQKIDLPKIVKALNLKNNQTVFDLGAGDGIVIFQAAEKAFQKRLNTMFVAVEINPVLILILHCRRLFHPNRQNIRIIRDDIFKINIKDQILKIKTTNQSFKITIYLYISPWYLEKVIENCLPAGKAGKLKIENFAVVSYMYPIKSLKNKEKTIEGKNKIFVYN